MDELLTLGGALAILWLASKVIVSVYAVIGLFASLTLGLGLLLLFLIVQVATH